MGPRRESGRITQISNFILSGLWSGLSVSVLSLLFLARAARRTMLALALGVGVGVRVSLPRKRSMCGAGMA